MLGRSTLAVSLYSVALPSKTGEYAKPGSPVRSVIAVGERMSMNSSAGSSMRGWQQGPAAKAKSTLRLVVGGDLLRRVNDLLGPSAGTFVVRLQRVLSLSSASGIRLARKRDRSPFSYHDHAGLLRFRLWLHMDSDHS
jgi:hypothetical protein